MTPRLAPRAVRLLASTLIVAAVTLVFAQVLRFEFVAWDDSLLIYNNPLYKPPSVEKIAAAWRGPYLDLYTPLTYTLWGILAALSWQSQEYTAPLGIPTHLTPAVFHAANFLLHVACALLAYAILRRVLRCHEDGDEPGTAPGAARGAARGAWCEGAAACGALLFALHPLQVEAVAWISELKGMLSSCLVLAALWQFLLALQDESARRRRLHGALATLCFLLALLAKPAAVPAPLMALVLGRAAAGLSWRELARRLWVWWFLAVAGALIARGAQSTADVHVPLWWRPFVAGDALAFYLAKLLWPLQLAPHYARTPDRLMAHWWAYATWMAPVFVAVALWLLHRRAPRLASMLCAGALLFVAPLLPVLGLATFRYQTNSTVADRYAFLALLGPALLLAWGLARRPAPHKFAVAGALLLALGVLSFRQTMTWADSRKLFDHTLKVNPQSWMALGNLGALLEAEGDFETASQLYYQAIEADSSNTDTLNNLGLTLARHGDFDGAAKAFRKALAINPDYGNAWLNLGNALAVHGQLAEAVPAYQRAAQLLPFSSEAHGNLGLALAGLRRTQEAITAYHDALRLQPNDAQTHYNLGLAYANRQAYRDAQRAFKRAVQLQPDYWEARHAIGLILLRQGRRDAARQQWQALLRENPRYAPTRAALQALDKSHP